MSVQWTHLTHGFSGVFVVPLECGSLNRAAHENRNSLSHRSLSCLGPLCISLIFGEPLPKKSRIDCSLISRSQKTNPARSGNLIPRCGEGGPKTLELANSEAQAVN